MEPEQIGYIVGGSLKENLRVRLTVPANSVQEGAFVVVESGDWLFYGNLADGEKLYRIRTDGSQRAKIADDRVGYLNFDANFLYYTSTSVGNALFRIKPDGSGRLKLMDGGPAPGPIGIAGGKIYYRGLFEDLK